MSERKKITADLVLKKVIFLSQHLNDRLDLQKIGIK